MSSFLILQVFITGVFLNLGVQYGSTASWRRSAMSTQLFVSRFTDYFEPKNKDKPAIERCDILADHYKGETSNLEDLGKKMGYPIENHVVETEDRYILTVFRIKHGKEKDDSVRKPVMLQHGIMDSAAAFLAQRSGMAYFLADQGYDVWIGNARGTTLSRKHKDKDFDPDKPGTKFWDFSFHEMGIYDLPAVFEKIWKVRESRQRIHYIGMSMGTTQFLVMGSEKPQYLNYVDCIILMAPIARPKHMTLVNGINYVFSWAYFGMMQKLSKGEACAHKAMLSRVIFRFCISEGKRQKICKQIAQVSQHPKFGKNLYDFEGSVNQMLYFPAGVSVKSFLHYLQIVKSGKFQKFDYGKAKNKLEYHGKKPTKYNIENINKSKKKLFLLLGGQDEVASEVDVLWLENQLTNSVLIDEFRMFTHRDFHHSKDIETNLYEAILGIINKEEQSVEVEAPVCQDWF